MNAKLFLTIIFISNFCCAQDGHFVDEIKLYANYSFTENLIDSRSSSGDSIYFQMRESEQRMLNFSPAIVFGVQKRSAHEFEISKFNYSKRNTIESYVQDDETYENLRKIGNRTISSFQLKLRYEYKIGIFASKNWKIKPKLGISASPYIGFTTIISNIATQYDRSYTQGGIGFSLISRLEYQLNEKWHLDLNIPINLSNLEFIKQTVDNPLIRIENRTTTTINFTNHLSPMLRLGIVFKL